MSVALLAGCVQRGATPAEMLRDCQRDGYPGDCVDAVAEKVSPGATYSRVTEYESDYGRVRQFMYEDGNLEDCDSMSLEYPAAPTGPKIVVLFQGPGDDCRGP
jgi:hypothetical protein